MTAQTMDQVITQLDDIIEAARREKSRAGYFAALYRQVTVAVKQGITPLSRSRLFIKRSTWLKSGTFRG